MGYGHVLDLIREYGDEYSASTEPSLLDVRKGKYLALRGRGRLDAARFEAGVRTLGSAAHTMRTVKKYADFEPLDYTLGPIETLWMPPDESSDWRPEAKEAARWTLMIRLPLQIQGRDLNETVVRLLEKGYGHEVREIALESIEEGTSVQALHVGPLGGIDDTLKTLSDYAVRKGFRFRRMRHEIFFGDPFRTDAVRMWTILRIPVQPVPTPLTPESVAPRTAGSLET